MKKNLLHTSTTAVVIPLCFSVVLFFTSCFNLGKKEYQYVEVWEEKKGNAVVLVDQKPSIINAKTDSIAYIQAYLGFCFSQRDYKEAIPGTQLGKPVSFKLLNEASADIAKSVQFNDKEMIEAVFRRRVAEWQLKKDK